MDITHAINTMQVPKITITYLLKVCLRIELRTDTTILATVHYYRANRQIQLY